jgi:hypothetical protein
MQEKKAEKAVGKAAKESRREEPKQRKATVTVARVRRRGKKSTLKIMYLMW